MFKFINKKSLMFGLLSLLFLLTGCGDNAGTLAEYSFLGTEHDESWTEYDMQAATVNNQEMIALSGKEVTHKFFVHLSAEATEYISIELGYDFTSSSTRLSGTSVRINKGEIVSFYYRMSRDIYKVTERGKDSQTVAKEYPEYAWVIQDSNRNVIEDTRDGSILREGSGAEDIKDGVAGLTAFDSDYILPRSSAHMLNDTDLKNLTPIELWIARNEIYARHGRRFRTEVLQNYFNSKSWYSPQLSLGTEPVLTDLEWQNVKLILKYENT